MIDIDALFKVSYGMYIVCSGNKQRNNGFISNSVFQVTASPVKFAVCCNKENLTAEFISKYKSFSISVLKQNASADIIGLFGYSSGRDKNKLAECNVDYSETEVPMVLNDSIALMECKLTNTVDAGSHLMFIGEVIYSKLIEDSDPLTYTYYRTVKNGKAPKNAPTYVDETKLNEKIKENTMSDVYKCPICGYEHNVAEGDPKSGIDPNTPWENVSEDYMCPLCGAGKEDFYKL